MIIRPLKLDNEYDLFYKDDYDLFLKNFSISSKCSKAKAQKAWDSIAKFFFHKKENKDSNLFYTIDEEGSYCGHVWLYLTPEPEILLIAGIFIIEKYRGKGWGHKIMDFVENKCKELKREKIGLNVFGKNDIAIELYKKHGYYTSSLKMEKIII